MEQNKNILVSIIIPVYNAGLLIERCLNSVFSQKGEFELEVICIDDGSTDNSVELIEKYNDCRIQIIKQANLGPATARNRGIEIAKGYYMAFLDADDYWLPEFLLTTIYFLEIHKECVAASIAQRHFTVSGVYESPIGWENLAPADGIVIDDFYSFWAKYNHICTGSILIRTDIAKRSGGQRSDLRICEDLEYWALIATYGKIGYIPKLLYVSDGRKVTTKMGWVEKHLPRWKSAVTIENWQKRIIERNKSIVNNVGYQNIRGRIAKNLAYSILLSKRYNLAKEEIKLYATSYPNDKIAQLLRVAIKNPINWFIISRLLVYREYHRN